MKPFELRGKELQLLIKVKVYLYKLFRIAKLHVERELLKKRFFL